MPGSAERFTVHYRIAPRDDRPAVEHARDIAIEQTAEVPLEVLTEEHLAAGLTGRVEEVSPLPAEPGAHRVAVSYRCDLAGPSAPQLLNLLFGNISLKDRIRIVGLDLPEAFAAGLGGPRLGIEGLRRLVGVHGRPLACTALKPLGRPAAELAALAGAFARGGVDLVKDDHGLGDQPMHPFEERVPRCQEAVEEANARSGRRTLYFPMITGGFDSLDRQARLAVRHGVRGVLVGPMLAGPDALRHLSREYGLAVMAHPALTGTFFHDREHGMTPALLLGTLFRLLGADISIFPNAGGRFHFTSAECGEIAAALRGPFSGLAPAFPCPAGGMTLGRIPGLVRDFGVDTVLLIGGDVLRQGDREAATRAFMEAIRKECAERLEPPQAAPAGSCDWGEAAAGAPLELLRCRDYRWEGRWVSTYKDAGPEEFRGVDRQELIGRFGERTAFDLRYFEIAPGGYSSLECHLHEHVIIGVRGRGLLRKGEGELPVGVHDVAYVAPLEAHQLRNPGGEPFGFFCIVDHERDRPRPVSPAAGGNG